MPDAISIYRLVYEVVFPIFLVLGVVARVFGALGIGLVSGTILRRSVLRDASLRFQTPLIYLATAVLLGLIAMSPWSSPGTLAMLGIGFFIGYQFLERRSTPTVVEGEIIDEDVVVEETDLP